MKIFEAQQNAGILGLRDKAGKLYELEIAVLDYPMWTDYQALALKAEKIQKGNKGKTNEDKEKVADANMRLMLDQLKMLVPGIEGEMLNGFALSKLASILEYCVTQSSASVADERTPDEKKTVSGQHTKSLRSPGRASRSRRLKTAI